MIATATRDDSPDIYVWDLRRNIETRVTKDEDRDLTPIWIDDRELLFAHDVNTKSQLARRRVDLTTDRTILTDGPVSQNPLTLSADGQTVIVGAFPGGLPFLGAVLLAKPAQAEPLFSKAYSNVNAVISPDGHWIAYEAREGDRTEVYVRPFPNVNDRRFQISQGGATWPMWSRNGRELFYVSNVAGQSERYLTVVPITTATGTTFDWGTGTRLFNAGPYVRSANRGMDISRDGTKFLAIADPSTSTSNTRTVMRYVANWFDELKARVK
jgi:Tol biopolymer transport system component